MNEDPEWHLARTRAAGQLRAGFWERYLAAAAQGGDDIPFGAGDAIFEASVLTILARRLAAEVLRTEVFFTDRLSNRTLAGCLTLRDSSCVIAVNVRFRTDPETLAHTLLEEYAHAQQVRDGVDFISQRREYPYHSRPYELEAKRIATEILGYDPVEGKVFLVRDEPPGPLFDDPK